MTTTYVICEVDEQGRTSGFEADGDVGRFGESLENGQEVELSDGRTGTIDHVYSHIQTRQWDSNFVAVRIAVEE